MKITKEVGVRFWEKVNTSGIDNCWLWNGCKDGQGYGMFWLEGRSHRAHRVAYILWNKIENIDLDACHRCDNPGCVNPRHIFLGTHLDNMLDREAKGRNNPPKGEKQGSSILTEDAVRDIRSRATGVRGNRTSLAKEYGVHVDTIGHIVKRKSWKHIE